jgi:hypothetical protein
MFDRNLYNHLKNSLQGDYRVDDCTESVYVYYEHHCLMDIPKKKFTADLLQYRVNNYKQQLPLLFSRNPIMREHYAKMMQRLEPIFRKNKIGNFLADL